MLYLFKHHNKYLTRYGLLVIIEGYRPTCTRSSPNRTCFMFSNACSSSDSLWVSNPMGSDQSQKRNCQVPPDCWHLEKWQQVCRKRGRSRLTEREVAHTYCHRSTYAKDSWATWRDYFSLGKHKARCLLVVAETCVSPARQPFTLDNPTNSCATISHIVSNSTLAAIEWHQNIAIR
jgi:hypothetical protein